MSTLPALASRGPTSLPVPVRGSEERSAPTRPDHMIPAPHLPDLPEDGAVIGNLLAAFSASGQAVALYDDADRLRYANAVYRQIFVGGNQGDFTFPDLLRYGAAHGFGTQIEDDVEALIARTYGRRRKLPRRAFETDLLDGRWLWMEELALPNGWVMTVGSDITALKQNEKTLRRAHEEAILASRTDVLTGLPNRRYILELLDAALAGENRATSRLCIAILDLDRFKDINDAHGHETGDAVLRHFTASCRVRLRQGDHLGRLGGEEFLALIPGASLRDAVRLMDRVREGFPAIDLGAGRPGLRYTFSAGLAEAAPGDDRRTLLMRADHALYGAKAAGRNRSMAGLPGKDGVWDPRGLLGATPPAR
ncbi:GGDEF domain-containing protein [Roseicella aquatilis]|uniref:diguanylate cyclase n=1 Tax=Roseicella aquatilis TaxID=2527868 RepID=A0A4R4DMF7_9PROT|nr:sensor domain-containing diguanylate cyclase [Roseicella aquatilis]TCZ60844.1 diguanylate cyclase [Roseicella aquatilis]